MKRRRLLHFFYLFISCFKKGRRPYLIVTSFICFYLAFAFFRNISRSFNFSDRERINILFYGRTPFILSIGFRDNVSYFIPFSTRTYMYVPGGYGFYKIGALGKLSILADDKELITRTFSRNTGSHIDAFFAPKEQKIWQTDEKASLPPIFFLIKEIFSYKNRTNVSFFERLFIAQKIFFSKRNEYITFKKVFVARSEIGIEFDDIGFIRNYKGFFYEKGLREGDEKVQILYAYYYTSALNIARILEGEGIHVADIAFTQRRLTKNVCRLIIDNNIVKRKKIFGFVEKETFPVTALYIKNIFKCDIVKENVSSGVDMVFELSALQEKEWR